MAEAEKKELRKFPKSATAMDVVADLDLTGKYFLITGGNSGIGYETARALAMKNAHVVMACRTQKTAEEAINNILKEKADAKISNIPLDCTDLSTVEECAKKYLENDWPLHGLILNAGVYGPVHRVTDAGFEATFQINHLAQFYLTELLKERLIKSAPSRVVVVSSEAHRQVRWGPSNITWEKLSPTQSHNLNSAFMAYGISKFCNALYALELNDKLKAQGVTSYSLHPGVVKTNITRNSGLLGFFFKIAKPFVIGPEQGAATTVYTATEPNLDSSEYTGSYFNCCKPGGSTNFVKNKDSATRLWNLSEEMLKHYKDTTQKQATTE